MAVFEVFSHPEVRRYKSTVCSKATLILVCIFILTFIPPLFVVYRSYGFWIKEAYYRELPEITFKRELLLVLDLEGQGNYVTYSTYQKYNQLQQDNLRVPVIKAREEDSNRDGRNDKMMLDIEIPMLDSENVVGTRLLLVFYYRLKKFSSLYMESLAYIDYESSRPGAMLDVIGDLKVLQKQPLGHKGLDTRYNVSSSLIDSTSTYADTYLLSNILKQYSQRNVTTRLVEPFKFWTSGRGAGKPFKISATISYPEDLFLYTPGFWYLIKWGWIQYLSVLIVFIYIFRQVKIFIFQNQLVISLVEKPYNNYKSS
ncbi:hypothetical protein LOTGIDRAFT_115323 [Lottia gigantea]|uniref:Transmembrane protein 231 n=1 Tax=Lottia gigantea TaxID=225164 RepID=V3ZZC5_LOTGI|nr:hypothetical protein LOTGIDRAFT_115323 [Lottia gigantea]ESO96883.1 hypothetical protein LOTGIDRAFT_115323 [Lottia gigantea]